MKKKKIKNTSGITVCDSIVMSVKKKRVNFRRIEAILIALAGYISTIMVFLRMFDLKYNPAALVASAIVFSIIYIFLSLMGKNAIWLILATIGAGVAVLWRRVDEIALGYKFIYNVIYKASYHTKIEYYKFLDEFLERDSVTAFLIMGVWLLALIIFVFTIYRPHPIPTLIAVFPIIEIGMYNGLEVNIFWGMMSIAYLIAVFAMSTIDMGEYSGGNGGFVRKENLFFPKRQMRLKVTEKCAVYLVLLIMIVTGITAATIKLTGYKRSEALNQKRIDIRDAITSFSFENFADSVSDLTVAFGFTFKVETHKLGNVASMKYKDRTDMTVTFDNNVNGAVYLKEFTGSVYKDNEWSPLPENKYNTPIFSDFDNYGIYPQDFPYKFNSLMYIDDPERTLWIKSSLKGERSFAPYGTDSIGGLEYNHDSDVTSKVRGKKEFSYKFRPVDAESIMHMLGTPVRNVYTIDNIAESEQKNNIIGYIQDKSSSDYGNYISIDSELPVNMNTMYNQPDLIMAELLQNDYKSFVYENYLQIPDNTDMEEIREEFSEALSRSESAVTAVEKINILYELRGKVAEMAEYSLNPGKTPKSRDFVNYFLFENHKGYCTHYATAGVILARMAGIPARYATGYVIVGDDFSADNSNNDGSYTIDVKDNRSHAWIEVYLDGYGWVPFEFTAGFTSQSIDTTPTTATELPVEETVTTTAEEETPSETDTTENNRAEQTSTHSTNNNTDGTTAATSAGGLPIGTGPSGGGIHLSDTAKYIIYTIISIIALILFVILRRELIHYIRYKQFTEGKMSKRAGHMYKYTERLLAFVKIHRDEKSYIDFADYVENWYGGRYFAKGSFAEFVDTSLCAAFSDEPPDEKAIKKSFIFTQETAETIYKSTGIFGKFYLKYITCLI